MANIVLRLDVSSIKVYVSFEFVWKRNKKRNDQSKYRYTFQDSGCSESFCENMGYLSSSADEPGYTVYKFVDPIHHKA